MIKKDREEVKRSIVKALKSDMAKDEEYVYIDVTDIALLIGMDNTEALADNLVETHQARAVSGTKQLKKHRTGIAQFDRADLLRAIEEYKPNDKTDIQQQTTELQT